MPPLPIQRVPPGGLSPACLEQERARIYRMMTCWDGPRYRGFSTYSSRLRSFSRRSWSHPKRNPNSFSPAGFFYTGNELCIRAAKTNIQSVFIHSTIHRPISLFHLLTGHADETRCFHCGGEFKGLLEDNDDPWQEHMKWFPNCVSVRYFMEGNEQRPDAVDCDDINMKKHKCTIV